MRTRREKQDHPLYIKPNSQVPFPGGLQSDTSLELQQGKLLANPKEFGEGGFCTRRGTQDHPRYVKSNSQVLSGSI